MTLQLYKWSLPHINKIQGWFKEAFGFIPSRKQIILFSISSIDDYPPNLIINKSISYSTVMSSPIVIPNEYAEQLLKLKRDTINPQGSVNELFNRLILYRSLTLPKLIKTKTPTTYKNEPNINNFIDSVDGYNL